MYLYCHFGQLSTESYEKMSDTLYESNWPKLSVTIQKHIIVMIANMQKPRYYSGFGMVNLHLGTFINVITVEFLKTILIFKKYLKIKSFLAYQISGQILHGVQNHHIKLVIILCVRLFNSYSYQNHTIY